MIERKDREALAKAIENASWATGLMSRGTARQVAGEALALSESVIADWPHACPQCGELYGQPFEAEDCCENEPGEREPDEYALVDALVDALAKRILADWNREAREAGEPNNWPAQQEWDDLGGSSHAILRRAAQREAGIVAAAPQANAGSILATTRPHDPA
jgi:hypothetical protein